MRYCVVFLLLSRLLWSQVFEEEDDLGHYFNVNTVTGHLELNCIDLTVRGPIEFKIERSYSSIEALRKSREFDQFLLEWPSLAFPRHRHQNWILMNGWTVLPHTHFFLGEEDQYEAARIPSKWGDLLFYLTNPACIHGANPRHACYLVCKNSSSKTAGAMSSKDKIRNDYLKGGKNRSIHYLSDGTQRVYRRAKYSKNRDEDSGIRWMFWELEREITPSKHIIEYGYNDGRLSAIHLKNPSGDKTFTKLTISNIKNKEGEHCEIHASSNQRCRYTLGQKHKGHRLLTATHHSSHRSELFHYSPSRKGFGARLNALSRGGKERLHVHYYCPQTSKEADHWRNPRKSNSKPAHADKVRMLEVLDPQKGEFTPLALFSYPSCEETEITDYEGNRALYHYGKKEQLQKVEYMRPQGQLHCAVELEWEADDLIRKTKKDGSGQSLFERSFVYDKWGNVIKEGWQDFIGNPTPLEKTFRYNENKLIEEIQETDGLTYKMGYLKDTNLETVKLTLLDGQIIERHYSVYNDDHLLVATYTDDGCHPDRSVLTGVTQRTIKKYDLDPKTGMCARASTYYYDFDRGCEILVQSDYLTYDNQLQVIQTDTQFGEGGPIFSTKLRYDAFGNVIEKISPLGRVSTYRYDAEGLLVEKKEPGSAAQRVSYDWNGRATAETIGDEHREFTYDLKGRLTREVDPCGNVTVQTFDSFGNCIEIHSPDTIGVDGERLINRVVMTYDTEGNITSCSDALGNTTHTIYNGLKKPLQITHPDGSQTLYGYSPLGLETRVIHPDGTQVHTEYDALQRIISKKHYSDQGEELCAESWEYSHYHLLSYTDSKGLTTHYSYNGLGQKIREEAAGRVTEFEYDCYGKVSAIVKGGWKKVQVHNAEGELIEHWEQSAEGKIESHMRVIYDDEGRKQKTIRYTSQGPAEDHFTYDEMGRLTSHTDPEGNTACFSFQKVTNSLGQIVVQKTSIDPLGNQERATHDVSGRLHIVEKFTPQGEGISTETYSYDSCGNLVRRLITAHSSSLPIRTLSIERTYDALGRTSSETVNGEQTTTFQYDPVGRLICKTMPDNTVIEYTYDGLGRLLKNQSRSVRYSYTYDKGAFPVKATDLLSGLTWEREYNAFDEMIAERRPDGSEMRWEFDAQGRVVKLLLPDKTAIAYTFDGKHMTSVTRLDADQVPLYSHTYDTFDQWGHVESESHIFPSAQTCTTRDICERVCHIQTPYFEIGLNYGKTGLLTRVDNSLFSPIDYTYDALNQLKSEGDITHTFDPLGNPAGAELNSLNQISSLDGAEYTHDLNGNTKKCSDSSGIKTYGYDSLGRLTAIYTRDDTTIYTYDPFSRLYGKECRHIEKHLFSTTFEGSKNYYLYDRQHEIGMQDTAGRLVELRVLGLGIAGEIGAAVAMELDNQTYLPLHDVFGNIIALADASQTLVEAKQIDAFGRNCLGKRISPWALHSKRVEEELIFFGLRFYDPKLKRFLTPDPSGVDDSLNLYLFVHNSPPNRLDLFGLAADDLTTRAPIYHFSNNFDSGAINSVPVTAYYNGVQADWIVFSSKLHQLRFTPEEMGSGHFDILDHLGELLPKEGGGIGVVYARNGMHTSQERFKTFSEMISESVPRGVLVVAEYTPSSTLGRDVVNTFRDKCRLETNEAVMCEQSIRALTKRMQDVNKELKIGAVTHSRGGAIFCAAMDRLTEEERGKTKEMMYYLGIAPAEPILDKYCLDSLNVYSQNDWITGGMGMISQLKQLKFPADQRPYKIEFLNHNSLNGIEEHGFSGVTYRGFTKKYFGDLEKEHVFIKQDR